MEAIAKNGSHPALRGVRAAAVLFAACGLYLAATGVLMLARPGLIGMSAGAPLLFGLELSGPYMFLLMGVVGGGISVGLMLRVNLFRRAAILIAIAGVVMLVPPVSAATTMVQARALAIGGLGIVVRVMVAWHLSRREVAEEFSRGTAK